jgi:uncharacterized membrane protein YfcA
MIDPDLLLMAAPVFLLAGTIKGVIGLGLPTVSLGLLTALVGLQPAMVLMLAPSFVTNLWQALVGGNGVALLRRLWPFLAVATLTISIGAQGLARLDVAWLSALLGALLVAYGLLGLARLSVSIPPRSQRWLGPVVGLCNGVLTGLTGSFVVPGVLYLQSIGLRRVELIQAMGILFTLSTAALGIALGAERMLSAQLGMVSALAVLPALLGMVLGQRLGRVLSEAGFRRVFFIALTLLGSYIVLRSALAVS